MHTKNSLLPDYFTIIYALKLCSIVPDWQKYHIMLRNSA